MKHKMLLFCLLIPVAALFLPLLCAGILRLRPFFRSETISVPFRTQAQEIQILQPEGWQNLTITGVNMGSAQPGSFPNEDAIPKETYLRWFQMIREMHANTIRVYKLQSPTFYGALQEFNRNRPDPLYLIQTIDFSEYLMYSAQNLFSPSVSHALFQEGKHTIDALHGNYLRLDSDNKRLDFYLSDVSDYVLGYLLGVEWDEVYVDYICRMNPHVSPYQGTYLSASQNANPFEIFLARWGDVLLAHETDRYRTQRLISFCNWPDTDPFYNEMQLQTTVPVQNAVEPDTEVLVDVEHIRAGEALHSGIFASYNVYPYYPLFLQYGSYTLNVEASIPKSAYQTYLEVLNTHHSVPVIITEYGIPSSRSRTHDDIWRNFTHGGLNEREQGQAIAALHQDILAAGCAGSLVFNWQDEWYKRTWNEQMISDPNNRAFWSNAESSEQAFGLLSFDPGNGSDRFYPDGDRSEWKETHFVQQNGELRLSMHSDEKYVYFLLENYDPAKGARIALDLLPDAGVTHHQTNTFAQPADFLLTLDPQDGGQLLVHDDYSLLLYSISDKMHSGLSGEILADTAARYPESALLAARSDDFHVVQRASGSIYSYIRHALDMLDVGNLTQGNANPTAPDYNSNADYCVGADFAEIRIPWQLLNFRDPSHCIIVDDLFRNGFAMRSKRISAIYAAPYHATDAAPVTFGKYPLTGWTKPQWHERLKASYYILQKEFEGANAA